MPSILGQGGSGGFQQNWNPFGSVGNSGAPAVSNTAIGAGVPRTTSGNSAAQLPAAYSQSQPAVQAQIPQSYAQANNFATIPGGAGTNPNISGPRIVGQMPGGAGITAGGQVTPYWGPAGETENQGTLTAMMRSPSFDPNWGGSSPGGNPARIANAMASAGQGVGVGLGGFNPGNSTVQSWLNDPNITNQLPYAWTPPAGYTAWQNQQNQNSLMGDLSSWTKAH